MGTGTEFSRARRLRALLCGVSLATIVPGGAALAQQAPVSAADAAVADDIVVVARGRTEKLLDVPVAATVATLQDIRRNDITTVANLKIVVPQISLDRGFTGSGTSITMRGVSSSVIDAGVEQSVLLDFDGVAISRGRILNDALFDLAGVDVLKGPQPVFFGKNSPGGVVSVKSADPTSELSGFVRGGYEFNARTTSVEAAVSGPLSDELGARVALFTSSSKGYIRNMATGVADPFVAAGSPYGFIPAAPSRLGAEDKIAGRLTLKYSGADLKATFKLLVSKYEGQGLQSFSEVMGCTPGYSNPIDRIGATYVDQSGDCSLNDRSSQGWINPAVVAKWPEVNSQNGGQPYSKNVTVMPVLRLTKNFGQIEVTSVTGYYDYDYVSQGNADATAYSYFWSYSNEKNKSFYQELRAVSNLAGPLNFAAGGHFEYNDRTLFVGGLNGRPGADAATGKLHTYDNQQGNKSSAFSLFGQVRFKPTDQLEISAGGRYTRQVRKLDTVYTFVNSNVAAGFRAVGDHITGRKAEDNFSPEVTVSYKLAPNVMAYAAYKSGYLAGGFSNPGVPSRTATAQTLSFDAEKVNGFEVGLKGAALGNTLTGSITGYRYVYKGLPLTSLVALGANQVTYLTQNAADTLAQGVEVEAAWRPTSGTRLNATASYNDAKFRSFAGAQCYAGQTAALGCVVVPGTTTTTQDLSGKRVYRSPDWILTAGASQEFALSSDLNLTANADVRYTSGYFATIGLNPVSYQKGFTTLNAGLRLSTADDKWGLALIARNLTNVRYATLGVDKPGGAGDVFAVAGEPRAVVVQADIRF
ncbi:MAG: TonB-dependent receptor [Sphingomonadales bacterium]|nr:TonB-dependent receptor [Sphingomonadales bacterium]